MPTLLLRLAAPLQAWGDESNFDTRRTQKFPTKSGVIGMLAAALGRSRTEALSDLSALKFGVRIDCGGEVIVDFHTAKAEKSAYITYREYLSDAVFVVGLESENRDFLEEIRRALNSPVYPLFLGRRSCPPTLPLVLGEIRDCELLTALKEEEWQLSAERQRRAKESDCKLRIITDSDEGSALIRDVPISFDPTFRKFGFRRIKDCGYVQKKRVGDLEHDPMSELR